MTLDQIVVFKTIVAEGSFRAAADRLHRAQSAVSYAIKELEQWLGQPIFDRQSYRATLTAVGRRLLTASEPLLKASRDLEAFRRDLSGEELEHITVFVSALFPIAAVADVFNQFSRRFPMVELKLHLDVLAGLEVLDDGRADLVVTEKISNDRLTQLPHQEMLTVKLLPVCSPHLIAELGNPATSQHSVMSIPQIVLRSTSIRKEKPSQGVYNAFRTIQVGDMLTKLELILEGVGWGLMPEYLIRDDLSHKQLVQLNIPDVQERTLRFYMVTTQTPVAPSARFLWNTLKEACLEEIYN